MLRSVTGVSTEFKFSSKDNKYLSLYISVSNRCDITEHYGRSIKMIKSVYNCHACNMRRPYTIDNNVKH